MKNVKAIKIVYQKVKNQVREAERMMASSKSKIDKAQEGMGKLEEYKKEYTETGYTKLNKTGPMEMDNFHRFLFRIDDAVAAQRDALKIADFDFNQLKALWQKLKGKEKGLESIIAKEEKENLKKQEKEEQKMFDEFSIRNFNNPLK
jgi:flagellar export protein FliJ